jgi:hypothetical protein
MEHCEVYCTAACCGTQAFELHPALLLRKIIDINIATQDGSGSRAFSAAWGQLQKIRELASGTEFASINSEVLFWKSASSDCHEFSIPVDEVLTWLAAWDDCFSRASRTVGLDSDAAT